jgi:hypothetical protein
MPASVLERPTSSRARARSRSRTSSSQASVAQTCERQRRDERVPTGRVAPRVRVELARRVEHCHPLVDAVQVHRPRPIRLQSPALPLGRIPADQLVLERQVQDPGQVLQGLVDRPRRERAEDAAFAVEQRPARGDRLPASFGFDDLGAAVPIDLLYIDLGQPEPREVRQQVAADRPLVVGQCAARGPRCVGPRATR